MTRWTALLELTRTSFRAPSFALFADLLFGWVCAPGRRTITAMIAVADPDGRRAHDACHRFVRDGAWAMSGLWRVLAVHATGRRPWPRKGCAASALTGLLPTLRPSHRP